MMNRLLLTLVLLFVGFGCNLFSGGGDEMVLPATSVGTPVGDPVKKEIGPSGGSLSSSDGKLTLTVPKNAVGENTLFSIQPITSTAESEGGPAVGYRLQPSRNFSLPLDVSFRYDEKDLAGTLPEALSLAYQDKQGAWHVQKKTRVDPQAKTLTISMDHFTDVSSFARVRIRPPSATLHPGQGQSVEITICEDPGPLSKLDGLDYRDFCNTEQMNRGDAVWTLDGPGTTTLLDSNPKAVMYTAPPTKPQDNVAHVNVEIEVELWDSKTGSLSRVSGKFRSVITIIGTAYKASGSFGPNKISGIICDIDKDFKLKTSNPLMPEFSFKPSSEDGGYWSFPYVGGVVGGGVGEYSLEGPAEDRTAIVIKGPATGTIGHLTKTGAGTVVVQLVQMPLVADCGG